MDDNDHDKNNESSSIKLNEWKSLTDDYSNASLLIKTTTRLSLARQEKRFYDLQFLLSGVLKRNHLGIHAEELHNKTVSGTKDCIEAFQIEVENCLNAIVNANESEISMQQKLAFFKKERRSLGQSALCMSGGGSICMYHIGVMKGLMDAGLFKHINVFSGASGGSIIAGAIAMMNESELKEFVIHPSVATDFKHDGSQKATDSFFFPSLLSQFLHFMKHGVLMDKQIKKTSDFYYGDITFAEAYARTKRHVSISVTANGTGSRLLLNHISSPHVTLASAVAASCALPAIMLSQQLEAKDATGKIVTFDVDGTNYVDGSIGADLPFKRLSTLFNVSSFFVSQVNFHVSPFMHKADSPLKSSYYWNALKFCEDDLRHRAHKLAKLGVLPEFFGVSMRSMVKQKYHGDVTMVPSLSPLESIGLKAIMNPTPAHMEGYIAGGERTAWPHINRIRFMMRTEIRLRRCVSKLRTMLIEKPKSSQDDNHLLQLHSLKSETSVASLANPLSSLVELNETALLHDSHQSSIHSDVDEFGLLSDDDDHDDDEEEEEEEEGVAMDKEEAVHLPAPISMIAASDIEAPVQHSQDASLMLSFPFPTTLPSSAFNIDLLEEGVDNDLIDAAKKNGKKKTMTGKRGQNRLSKKSLESKIEQLKWEMKGMADQMDNMRSENIELRTRLCDISALAELAVSTSPTSPSQGPAKRKNTYPY